MKLLLTGGSGFIGSHIVEYYLQQASTEIILNIDRLDTCSSRMNHPTDGRYHFLNIDLSVAKVHDIVDIILKYEIEYIIHAAASTFVDASFDDPLAYSRNNLFSTQIILESMRKTNGQVRRMVHISTDEVLGDDALNRIPGRETTTGEGGIGEHLCVNPTSPYAASKAIAECIIRSYQISFQLPVVIVRPSNVYGPRQYPEKVIPRFIQQTLAGKACSVHDDGSASRTFIYVSDIVGGIDAVLWRGKVGRVYCLSGDEENTMSMVDVARAVQETILQRQTCNIEYVKGHRLFNDKQYSMNDEETRKLGWRPGVSFRRGLEQTVEWYRQYGEYWWSP